MRPSRRKQSGVVLFIALIILVAMSLAGIALIRSVDTSNLIAGNLAFRQGATIAGDWGLESARSWLLDQATNSPSNLYSSSPSVTGGSAYLSIWTSNVDFTGTISGQTAFDWTSALNVGTDAAGNQVSYIIHRMCQTTGDPANQNCIRSATGGVSTGSRGGVSYGSFNLTQGTTVYYRVTSKVTGPRNTVSYVQSIMN